MNETERNIFESLSDLWWRLPLAYALVACFFALLFSIPVDEP